MKNFLLPRRLRRRKRKITHICVLCGKYIVSTRLTRSVNLRYLGWPVKAIREEKKGTPLENLIGQKLREMFDLMLNHFGPQNWWPGETVLEIMVGAVLTQNTNWKNVEKAIKNLKKKDLLSLKVLHALSVEELAEEIRPVGFFNIKAKRLKNLLDFIADLYQADLSFFLNDDTETLREGLLSVKGVGPETADSILLYALHRPIFVVDAYTHRILGRHGMMDEHATYHELQALFLDHLPDDPKLFNEFHALFVKTGKEYCRTKPRCNSCPLDGWGDYVSM